MKRTFISEVLHGDMVGDEVLIKGWVYRERTKGKIRFVVVRDSTGIIQVTAVKGELPEKDFRSSLEAKIESSVEVVGIVTEDKRAPGGYEIQCRKFNIIGKSEIFPITKDQSEEFLLDNRHLWIRSRKLTQVMKVKHTLLFAAREWFYENGFYEVTPPIITSNACEGGSTLFELDYFDMTAYLSQSAQLYLEAISYSLEYVYGLTPSFRAEKSRTKRHLAEYWHLEGEEMWTDNNENMRIQEELVTYILHKVAKERKEELEFLGRNAEDLLQIEPPFKRIYYKDAIKILQDKGSDIAWGDDLGTNDERLLVEGEVSPVFVVDYAKEAKAFYMKENPDDHRTYLCADLLAPEGYGEIIGGSERETDVNKLIERLKSSGVPLEPYQWYLDLRRYGTVQHSGFGLGIERVVRWICKLDHIRDAIPFPRVINRVYP